MGDLSKLRIGVGQVEVVDGRPSRNEASVDKAVDAALDEGADILIAPGSLTDEQNVRLISLNDSRLDISGNVAVLDACGDTYRIALGEMRDDCDFSVCVDLEPYSLRAANMQAPKSSIVLRPVGMLDRGKRIVAFDGGSYACGARGERVVALEDGFAEGACTFSFDGTTEYVKRCDKKLLTAIVATLKRFDAQVLGGTSKWVIGLSGGLDSTVVAALLVLAFGPDRVVGYNMATRFNTAATIGNAAKTAHALGIEVRGGSIEDMVVSLGNTLVRYGYAPDALSGIVLENAQARTRGHLLSTFAALQGGVVVNNGNRVECALGYATLYGDAIGALAPIGDVTKVELFGIARDINETFGYEVVAENLLPTETDEGFVWETMPSAELSSGQVDPMKWFYHDWLIGQLLGDGDIGGADASAGSVDAIACALMERYLDDRLLGTDVGKWVKYYGLDDPCAFADDLAWVLAGMRRSAYKRIQAPPTIALASPRSFAADATRQVVPEPSQRFRVLESKIRKL